METIVHPQPLYFEDFRVQQRFESPARTMTQADVGMFAALTGDYNPLHTDAEFARTSTPFGVRIAHGLLGLSVASGLFSRMGLVEGTVLAFLELSWKFIKPIVDGDTIRVSAEVTAVRRSKSNPDRGIVSMAITVSNQRNEEVQQGTWTYMMRCRSAGT